MPPSTIRKSRRQRGRRGRIYLLGTLVLIITIAVGWYVYASAQSANNNVATTTPPPTTTEVVYAKLNTSKGLIEVELYQSATPETVTNFVNLARSGFYDNLVWHRIVNGFVIQTGDPNTRNVGNRSTWGQGGSSQTVPLEIDVSLHNYAGYLGMAHAQDPNSGSSQFYINLGDNSANLDGKYTVFGKVISGMDTAFAIANVPVYPQSSPLYSQPIDPVFLTSVTISSSP